MMKRFLALLALAALFGAAARADDDPEMVYRKLHRAALAADLDGMLKYSTEARRAEISSKAGSQVAVRMMGALLPKTFKVVRASISPNGGAAELRATGMHALVGAPAPMYGTVSLLKESGEWRVDRLEWSSDKPLGFDGAAKTVKPRPAPPQQTAQAAEPKAEEKPEAKPPAAEKPAPKAELETAKPAPPPEEKKAAAKPRPCVIKPVMTDEDFSACGAHPPGSGSLMQGQ
jgi:hypothetical protein